MSSSDDVGNGVRASGNVINNNGANNSGVGAGGQNFGQGAGCQNNGPGAGSRNYGQGTGSHNNGPGAGTQNYGPATQNYGQNYGPGAGSNYGGNLNIGAGAGGTNSGAFSGSINHGLTAQTVVQNKSSSENTTAETSVGRGTEPAPIKTENPHGGHNGQPSSVLAKSSEADDLALRLLKNLKEINKDRNVSLDRFAVTTNNPQMVDMFAVPEMLAMKARHLLDIFPNLTTRSKVKKGMIEVTFLNLCAAMQYMEVTPFAEMNEDSFYLFRDAIEDAESINFEVGQIREHLLNLAKAYLGMVKFGMVGGNTVGNLDKRIEQAKNVEEMEKFLAKTKDLLMSVKAYLESLNQEKECLSSSGMSMIELCQTYIETAKTFGEKPGPLQP